MAMWFLRYATDMFIAIQVIERREQQNNSTYLQ